MANIPGGKGGPGGEQGDMNILSKLTENSEAQTKALRTNAEALTKVKSDLENVGLAEDEAAAKTKKFSDALKDQVLKTSATLSVTKQLTGALSGYVGQLTKAASFSQHYARMLAEVDEAQKLYVGSVNLSSKSVGNASQQLQKHINVLRDMKVSASELSSKYSVSIKEIDKVNEAVMSKFSAQIMSVSRSQEEQKKLLKDITETVFVAAKVAGMEVGEAMEFMGERAAASNKTIGQLRDDMKGLTVTIDHYRNRLKALDVDTDRTLLTSKQLVSALSDLQKRLEHGAPSMQSFGKMMGEFAANMHKAGLSQQIVQRNLVAMNKVFGELSKPDLTNYFGTVASMELVRTGGEGILGEDTKKELQEVLKGATGLADIQKARLAGEVAQKDIGYQRDLAKRIMGLDETLRHEMLLKMGGGTAIGTLEMTKQMEKLVNMTDEEVQAARDDKESVSNQWLQAQKAVIEAMTPDDKAYQAAVGIRTATEKIERFLSTSFWASFVASVAALAVHTYYLRKISLLKFGGPVPGGGPGGGPGGPVPVGGPGGKPTPTRPRGRVGRAFSSIKSIGRKASSLVRRRPGTTTALAMGGMYAGERLLGRDLTEGEQAATDVGMMGAAVAPSMYSRYTGAAKPAAAPMQTWQAKQMESVKKALDLQKTYQAKHAEMMASLLKSGPGAPVTKTPGLWQRTRATAGRAARAARGVGGRLAPVGRALAPVGRVASKALGPIAIAAGALLSVPALIDRWKKADTVGGKAKAVGHYALEATGIKSIYRAGKGLGNWADRKTRGITDKVTRQLGLGLAGYAKTNSAVMAFVKAMAPKDQLVTNILDKTLETVKTANAGMEKSKENAAGLSDKTLDAIQKEKEKEKEKASLWERALKAGDKTQRSPMENMLDTWNKEIKKRLGGDGSVFSILEGATDTMRKGRETSMMGAIAGGQTSQKLVIEPGKGEGSEDSDFSADPVTGDIRMKLPGNYVTIRQDAFQGSVSDAFEKAIQYGR